ncbi:hypothetical protein E2C01_088401 [Portunus trituberculatus]|uniref:Uncharacterized protein n=1 Tax=Portunus trituberculatus TaxID=210409 RepID=A0A5B7JJ99_PORTR|nr:hypothetical protein [Portunus trituberculatus]
MTAVRDNDEGGCNDGGSNGERVASGRASRPYQLLTFKHEAATAVAAATVAAGQMATAAPH